MAGASDTNMAVSLLKVGRDEDPALFFRDEVITYLELRQRVGLLASSLLADGLQHGERVGLFSDNTPFFVISYLAVILAGGIAVPFFSGIDEQSFREIVASTGMRRILLQVKNFLSAQEWAEGKLDLWPAKEAHTSDGTVIEGAEARPSDLGLLDSVVIDPQADPAVILFTSGSTGRPKGVMISHRNIECNTEDIISYMGLTRADRVLAALPFSYCFGASLLHTHLRAGASIVLCSSFMFPEKVLDELRDRECTGFAGVPSTYQILLRKTHFAEREFPALRWFQQAGGRLPDPFIRELREAHPNVRFFLMYGQTEATARLSYLPPEMLDKKFGSIGRGLQHTQLQVLKEDGTPVCPGSDEVGEIVASGENIALGYWNDQEESLLYFRGGKLHTGDMARVDEDGYIYVVDRARDFIKSMGNRVSAREIEDVICGHPQVVQAAVIGVPDELWGEAIAAYVVPLSREKVSEEDLKAYCNECLPNFKLPQRVVLVDSLPLNAYGKIRKEVLREQARNDTTI